MNSTLMQMQTRMELESASPITIGIFVGLIIIIFIFFGIASRGSIKRHRAGKPQSKHGFRKTCHKMGLIKTEIRILENLAKKYSIKNPSLMLTSPRTLNNTLKKQMEIIHSSGETEQIQENQKYILFRIKQKIDMRRTGKVSFQSSKQLPSGQRIVIAPEGGGRFQSKVVANLSNSLSVAVPAGPNGQQVRLKKWSRLMIHFWKKDGQGYSFPTKIIGYSNIKGATTILIQHSTKIKSTSQRKFQRKMIEKPAYFFPVNVLSSGKGKQKQTKAYVDSKSAAMGTLLDISAGGCSLKSSYPLGTGQLIKVEFETAYRQKVGVYGKIIKLRRMKPMGGIMHIMFTRVTRGHLNKINTFVYNFEE